MQKVRRSRKCLKKHDDDKVGKITKEEKEREIKYIEKVFSKEGESS